MLIAHRGLYTSEVKENTIEHMCKKCGAMVKEEIRKE